MRKQQLFGLFVAVLVLFVTACETGDGHGAGMSDVAERERIPYIWDEADAGSTANDTGMKPRADVQQPGTDVTSVDTGSEPGVDVHQPGTDVVTSVDTGSEPGADVTQPGTDVTSVDTGSEPGIDVQQPGTDVATSVDTDSEPGTDVQQPGTDVATSVDTGSEPGTDVQQPGTDVATSVDTGSEPGTDVQQPGMDVVISVDTGSECLSDMQCNDGNPCTIDFCNDDFECGYVDDLSCECADNSDCNDQNSCTNNLCVDNSCEFPPNGMCACQDDVDCQDSDACTDDSCVAGACHNDQRANCACVQHQDCDDNDPCAEDRCVNNVCSTRPVCDSYQRCEPLSATEFYCVIPRVCGDANPEETCDDGNGCTLDVCSGGECEYVPLADCVRCVNDVDCRVNDAFCSTESATRLLVNSGRCVTGACEILSVECRDGGCVDDGDDHCENTECADVDDCNDGNACSQDSCVGGYCRNAVVDGCIECNVDGDCPLGDLCSDDGAAIVRYAGRCDQHQCAFGRQENCAFGCEAGACREFGECLSDFDCVSDDNCVLGDCVSGQCEWTRYPDCRTCDNDWDCDADEAFCSETVPNVRWHVAGSCEEGFCTLSSESCPSGCAAGACATQSVACATNEDCPGLMMCLSNGTCGHSDDYIVCTVDCNHGQYENFNAYIWWGFNEDTGRSNQQMFEPGEKFVLPYTELCYWQPVYPTFDMNCRNLDNNMWDHGYQAVVNCNYDFSLTRHPSGEQGKALFQVTSVLCN